MKKLSTLLLLAFFSTLAFAHTATPSNDNTNNQDNEEILVAPIGFDKVLSLIIFEVEQPTLDVELSQNKVGRVYNNSFSGSESEVLEIDLSDFESGTYTLKITAGDYSKVHTLILP